MVSAFFVVAAFVVAAILYWCTSKPPSGPSRTIPKPSSTFKQIRDKYDNYEQLQHGLRAAGLESSNLIVGVDFTKSNEWTGKRTFMGHCLHALSRQFLNPYQTVIQTLGKTLEAFDDDKLIPAYGFGDSRTRDQAVFPFVEGGRSCNGFQEVMERYTAIVPQLVLQGPTSFAPIIREAIRIVKAQRSYHILLIVADGQVTNEADTVAAIVEASRFPLSIVLVGVGDGPWEIMKEFDDGLPERAFDNFQFVDFDGIMRRYDGNELAFACAALQEVPEQYQEIKRLNLFRNCNS